MNDDGAIRLPPRIWHIGGRHGGRAFVRPEGFGNRPYLLLRGWWPYQYTGGWSKRSAKTIEYGHRR